jgi:hypothetical protein
MQRLYQEKMIEQIRTFNGKVVGLHGDKRTVVRQSIAYRCTKCGIVWLQKPTNHDHANN